MFKRLINIITHRLVTMPVLVMMPHSRCNCRCVMCDIWKANNNKKEISAEELQRHVHHFKKLGVCEIVFSGGEALMHSNLWRLCSLLQNNNIKLTLLSTGLAIERNVREIINYFSEVIVSLDGSPTIHDKIRNIPNGFATLASGVAALKKIRPGFRVTGRSVLQRYNYHDFINTVRAAKEIGLDQISFLPADVSTSAFNHIADLTPERVSEIALNRDETAEFEKIIDTSFIELKEEYSSRFIAESIPKMQKIVQYYKAVNKLSDYPETVCNAPWVSAVIESNGDVMPCFFHKPYGNIYDNDLLEVLNSKEAIAFRKHLKVKNDEICKKCVCSLKLGLTEMN